jgi:hypothetical protein
MYIDKGDVIQEISSGKFIPKDENNIDYQSYLTWIDSGNVPTSDISTKPITIEVSDKLIIADGVDSILLSVNGPANTTVTIDTLVGSTVGTINVSLNDNGFGSQSFSCDTPPSIIVFSHGETEVRVRAL